MRTDRRRSALPPQNSVAAGERGERASRRRCRGSNKPQTRGEREEWAGHRLGGAVAGEERIVAHPAGPDERLTKERQHDMAAAEDERARAVESIEQGET